MRNYPPGILPVKRFRWRAPPLKLAWAEAFAGTVGRFHRADRSPIVFNVVVYAATDGYIVYAFSRRS
jgi:hypothetical protein